MIENILGGTLDKYVQGLPFAKVGLTKIREQMFAKPFHYDAGMNFLRSL